VRKTGGRDWCLSLSLSLSLLSSLHSLGRGAGKRTEKRGGEREGRHRVLRVSQVQGSTLYKPEGRGGEARGELHDPIYEQVKGKMNNGFVIVVREEGKYRRVTKYQSIFSHRSARNLTAQTRLQYEKSPR